MGPPVGFFIMALIFWGVPLVGVALAVRWGIRVRRALEARPQDPTLPPGRVERLEEELQAMSLRLDSLEEKQEFMVKLLGAAGRSAAPPERPGAPPRESD